MFKRSLFALLCFGGLSAGVVAQPYWGQYAGNPQHTADAPNAIQRMRSILWQTPVDLYPPYVGSTLYIHYASPLIAAKGTVIVTVRTGPNNIFPSSNDTFRVEGHDPGTGALLWTEATDYTTPPHDWIPGCGSAIAPSDVMYTPGAGGTVWVRSNADSASASVSHVCFYGLSTYLADKANFDSNVQICTPITIDQSGNAYFGILVTSHWANSRNLSSGLVRISRAGVGTWISADNASGDVGDQIPLNCAPAVSNDGKYVYIATRQQGGNSNPKLLRLDSTTLHRVSSVALVGPKATNGDTTTAYILDDGTPTPLVGPDGDVFYGIWYTNLERGFMLHFSGDLSVEKTPSAFGWDDTASILPSRIVPGYKGSSPYLILTKYNNYADSGINGDGLNKVAILDPGATEIWTERYGNGTIGDSFVTMKEVATLLGPTKNSGLPGVREWCINTAVIDVAGKAAIVNSEDGHCYRWDFTQNYIIDNVNLAPPTGEAYTPTMAGPDGIAFAINNAQLCALWDGVKPSQVGLTSNSIQSGSSTTGTVTLAQAATGPGATVRLSSSNPNVQVPATALVPAGTTSVAFKISTSLVNANQTATITANRYGFKAASSALTVVAPVLKSFTIDNANPYMTDAVIGTVTLAAPAGANVPVAVKLSDTFLVTVSNPVVLAGQTTAQFKVRTAILNTNATHVTTVTTVLNSSSLNQAVNIHPILVQSVSANPTVIHAGQSSTATVTITQPAGDYALPMRVTCPSSLVTVPSVAYASAGSNKATFTITADSSIPSATVVTVYVYLCGVYKSVQVTVEP